jgi:hypothetical protein
VQKLKNSQDAAPAYKPSILANTQRIILAQAMHPTSETAVLAGLWRDCGQRFGETPKTLLADAGYHCGGVLSFVVDEGIDGLIPSGQRDRNGSCAKAGPKGKLGKREFVFDEAAGVYVCPGGRKLTVLDHGVDGRGLAYARYQVRDGGCADCALRKRCQIGKEPRRITRYAHDGIADLMQTVLEQKAARRCYAKRQASVEPVFGALRWQFGLTRFSRRGLRGAALEFGLTAAAYNLVRGVRLEALKTAAKRHFRRLWRSRRAPRESAGRGPAPPLRAARVRAIRRPAP